MDRTIVYDNGDFAYICPDECGKTALIIMCVLHDVKRIFVRQLSMVSVHSSMG